MFWPLAACRARLGARRNGMLGSNTQFATLTLIKPCCISPNVLLHLGARQERDAGVRHEVHSARQRRAERRPARAGVVLGARRKQRRAAARAAASAHDELLAPTHCP